MYKVLFMGRKSVAADALRYALTKERINIVGVLTDNHLAVSPVSDVANDYCLPIYEYEEALNALRNGDLEFDLGLSMLYWRRLKEEFLSTPRLGCINFHPAPLPEYKGTAGYNMAILEGLENWAATAHYMDENIDTGGILRIIKCGIDLESETAYSLEKKTAPVLLQLFKETLDRVLANNGLLATSPNTGGRYITRKEMEEMKEVLPGDDVNRKIRAFWFPPYDGAFVVVNGIRCTLVNRLILSQLADSETSSLFTVPAD